MENETPTSPTRRTTFSYVYQKSAKDALRAVTPGDVPLRRGWKTTTHASKWTGRFALPVHFGTTVSKPNILSDIHLGEQEGYPKSRNAPSRFHRSFRNVFAPDLEMPPTRAILAVKEHQRSPAFPVARSLLALHPTGVRGIFARGGYGTLPEPRQFP